MSYSTVQVHISTIHQGDTVIHNGKMKTVSGTDIKEGGFLGKTIFGDSYHSGYHLVTRVVFK